MRRAAVIAGILTLFVSVGHVGAAPASDGKKPTPAAAGKAAVTARKNVRCPDNEPWTDEVVAKSLKVPVERLRALKAARSLDNGQICTASDKMLARALNK